MNDLQGCPHGPLGVPASHLVPAHRPRLAVNEDTGIDNKPAAAASLKPWGVLCVGPG
jgi:hypothetical protein